MICSQSQFKYAQVPTSGCFWKQFRSNLDEQFNPLIFCDFYRNFYVHQLTVFFGRVPKIGHWSSPFVADGYGSRQGISNTDLKKSRNDDDESTVRATQCGCGCLDARNQSMSCIYIYVSYICIYVSIYIYIHTHCMYVYIYIQLSYIYYDTYVHIYIYIQVVILGAF